MKVKGIFKNVFPMYPLGGGRKIHIITDDGESLYLTAHFEILLREEKHVKLGDHVELNYINDEDFTMRKI